MGKALVAINKVELLDGEELMDLAKKVMAAITQNRGKIKKSLGLVGIFKDHIVVRDFENGQLFRMEMKRDDAGNVQLDGMEEVRQVFMPLKPKTQKSDGDVGLVTIKDLDVVVEGGQLTEDSVAMIREHVASLAKAEPQEHEEQTEEKTEEKTEDSTQYLEVQEAGLWRGVL